MVIQNENFELLEICLRQGWLLLPMWRCDMAFQSALQLPTDHVFVSLHSGMFNTKYKTKSTLLLPCL